MMDLQTGESVSTDIVCCYTCDMSDSTVCILTLDVCGNRAIDTGRASPKHAVHTATWMGRCRRGHLRMKFVLLRK